VIITDFSGKIRVRQKNNGKNNFVYSENKHSISNELFYAPEENLKKD
jgi:hypothetical protein